MEFPAKKAEEIQIRLPHAYDPFLFLREGFRQPEPAEKKQKRA